MRTASGAQIQRADQKTIRCENGDDTLVSIKFKTADAIIPSDAVGELEERGMTVAMGPHGFVTGNQTTKLAGRNLSSKHPDSTYWMSLTRWEDCAKTVGPVDLEDVAREDTEANVPTPVTNPKDPGGGKRPRHEWTHVAHVNWCSSCLARRGTCVHLASLGSIIFNTTETESQTTAMVTAKAASDTLVITSLAILYAWRRSDAKTLLRPDQDVTLSLIRRKAQARRQHRPRMERSPKESHATIGTVERANRTLGGVLRTLKHAIETRVGSRPETDQLICCMVRHCCCILCRYQMSSDGRNSFEVL